MVRIYGRKSKDGVINNNASALSGKKAIAPPNPYAGFKNLQRIRAAGSPPGVK
ncbi:hypothetical protein [Niabella aurantiaca]|uniref:hypothetical protein n=1 Tax=Niabella aurantiaca TaxID=379900 RepID=UPI00037B2334|nr:hypothetical protein [Niabella aurantiaca]